ncbi:MAG: hypothetical protein HC831_21965 [Chloroflexia bacterium]|nr:hypothetical protein [Chloroflexia bacterium]
MEIENEQNMIQPRLNPVSSKGFFILMCLPVLLFACNPFLSANKLDQDEPFNLVFMPKKAFIAMDIDNQAIIGNGKLEDDLYIVVSEDNDRIAIFPFYKSHKEAGPISFRMETLEKTEKGFMAGIYDEVERLGYIWIQNKRTLNISIDLQKYANKKISKLNIAADCKAEGEVKNMGLYDTILLYSW